MGDRNAHYDGVRMMFFDTPVERELKAAREVERRNAEAQSFHALAYKAMPEDLRRRAREWDLEAFMCLVWSNAFQNGYLQAERDRQALVIEERD